MTPRDHLSCPSDEELAAYCEGRLDASARARVEAHAVECDECRAVIAATSHTLDAYGKRLRVRRYAAAGGATAAAAVIALLFITNPPDARTGSDPVLRNPAALVEAVPRFGALQPVDGAAVPRAALAFAWQGVAAGAVYQLTVSDERGGVVWRARSEETSLDMPAAETAALVTGALYYWRVEALLPDLTTAITPVRSFVVREP